ncbi:aminotransferase class IV [Fulvivirga ligni]|uniref:aminotransferase class IV n=1 Tax=Fulvivirga ligni TaxID=2904246 RepID=UPI001F2480E3|nr:aminotransferase class IV [Fulvivirga ligni]UII19246.1 aminotransferase class IV [Fulvivirga ligni]
MIALYNHKWIEDKILLNLNDRALQFGDGLFETILFSDHKPRLLNYHLERLSAGASAMNLSLPESILSLRDNQVPLIDLINRNDLAEQTARVKLIIWRQHEGQIGYSSNNTEANSLITAKALSHVSVGFPEISLGLSEKVTNYAWHMSQYKKLNSLPYIIGSQEKNEKDVDELIITDTNGNISECISSNIFWIKENIVYTPSLNTGCVAGVRRAHLMNELRHHDMEVKEVEIPLEDIKLADLVFLTNSLGIKLATSLESTQLNMKKDHIELLKKVYSS